MDRVSATMLRISLLWLLAGFVIGAAMLTDRALPGEWRLWFAPGHGHMLFVGWFLQFAVGVAYWLLPRRRSPQKPLGYGERTAFLAVVALNVGLSIRVIAEAAERIGLASEVTLGFLAVAALLQVVAAMIVVVQLWPRVAPRASVRPATAARSGSSPSG